MASQPTLKMLPPRAEMERAVRTGDASYDRVFCFAVRTTGIVCRPSCRPPRPPKPENLEYFPALSEAVAAGYRPCRLCRPEALDGPPPGWVAAVLAAVEKDPAARLDAVRLRALGTTPERVRRWFVQHHGQTFTAWCRARRLGRAFQEIRDGAGLDDVVFEHGYSSHSGFREAFARTFGVPPGQSKSRDCVVIRPMDTPIGPFLAGATSRGICCFEFADRKSLKRTVDRLRRLHGCAVVPGDSPHLKQLEREAGEYFAGRRRDFAVPLAPRGTAFQEQVWTALRAIPYGATESYAELARRIGRPSATRAVARANGDNNLAVVIPCHRVVGQDGELTGYGGGLWRKRLLLELERTGRLPGGAGSAD